MNWPGGVDSLTEAEIARRLALYPAESLPGLTMHPGDPAYERLRHAAVLIPLLRENSQWHMLLTRRAETLESHKGQVAFPGGAAEPEDASPEATAMREAFEEIGLRPEDVRILGRLSSRPTISSFLVTPVVAKIQPSAELVISPDEVSRVFTIPLAWLADPANREERKRLVPTGTYENIYFFKAYDGEILWGASARFTVDLLKTLGLAE